MRKKKGLRISTDPSSLMRKIGFLLSFCGGAFCGIWNDRKNSWACLWRKLLWTEGTTLVLFTGGWSYWELPVIFPPSAFPMTQVNMDFHMIRNGIHLFAQWDNLLHITV